MMAWMDWLGRAGWAEENGGEILVDWSATRTNKRLGVSE